MGGRGEGFGGGRIWGEGALEHWTLDPVTPHKGLARGEGGLDPKRLREAILKYVSRLSISM